MLQMSDTDTLDEVENYARGMGIRALKRGDENAFEAYESILLFLGGLTNDRRGIKPGQPLLPQTPSR